MRKHDDVARLSRSACACPGSSRGAPTSPSAGAILLDTILRRLGADEITLCDLSLREGLVLDYIARHRKQIAQADRYPDVRRRSVIELGRALQLLARSTRSRSRGCRRRCSIRRAAIHGLTDQEREWLEYAALLHDIGVHISYERPSQALRIT